MGAYHGWVPNVKCSKCGKMGARLVEKIDKNLRPVKALLCGACARKSGHTYWSSV